MSAAWDQWTSLVRDTKNHITQIRGDFQKSSFVSRARIFMWSSGPLLVLRLSTNSSEASPSSRLEDARTLTIEDNGVGMTKAGVG